MKSKLKNIKNRIINLVICTCLTVSLLVPNVSMPVYAANLSGLNTIKTAVETGSMAAGMLGSGVLSGVLGVAKFAIDFYNVLTNSGKQGDINTYYYNPTVNNYNTTVNYSVFNDYTKNTSVTTNWNYSFYNPITTNYNYTNDYSYNPQYHTYYYTGGDTQYYVTDNTTNISYYIIENAGTQQERKSYYEIYYQLPDGRNSGTLTKKDIYGQYFIYNISKYQSVAEDDGKTLGLWHLDGNYKDSSFHANVSGKAKTSEFKDGVYGGGKYLSSIGDYLELRINGSTGSSNPDGPPVEPGSGGVTSSLPSSWTLEWIQYSPESPMSSTTVRDSRTLERKETKVDYYPGYDKNGIHIDPVKGTKYEYYKREETVTHTSHLGVCGLSYGGKTVDNLFFDFPKKTFIPCALVCNGGEFTFYVNGNAVENYDVEYKDNEKYLRTRGGGLYVYPDAIKFVTEYVSSDSTDYYLEVEGAPSGIREETQYNIYEYDDVYRRYINRVECNVDTIIDEVRLSKGVLYTRDYTPQTEPFTTNTVLVVPDNPKENEVAFKTNYRIGGVRFGGARPTYPDAGYVYVSVKDNGEVETIQQFQETGWYSIDASIYHNGTWENLKGYNLNNLSVSEENYATCTCTYRCNGDGYIDDPNCPICKKDKADCKGQFVLCSCIEHCKEGSPSRNCVYCYYGMGECAGKDGFNLFLDNDDEYCMKILKMIREGVYDKGIEVSGELLKNLPPTIVNTRLKWSYGYSSLSPQNDRLHSITINKGDYSVTTLDGKIIEDSYSESSNGRKWYDFNAMFYGEFSNVLYFNSQYRVFYCQPRMQTNFDPIDTYIVDDITHVGIIRKLDNGWYIDIYYYQLPDGVESCNLTDIDIVKNYSNLFQYNIEIPDEPEKPDNPVLECNCTEKCTAEHVDENCPVCTKDWTECKVTDSSGDPGTDIPEVKICYCEKKCTDDHIDMTCSVCSVDYEKCTGQADEPINPDDPNKPDNPDNPDNPDDPGGEGGSIWDKIGKLIKGILDAVNALLGPFIDGILSLLQTIIDAITSLANFSGAFGEFLKEAFNFIPDEVISIIGLGIALSIFAAILKMFL